MDIWDGMGWNGWNSWTFGWFQGQCIGVDLGIRVPAQQCIPGTVMALTIGGVIFDPSGVDCFRLPFLFFFVFFSLIFQWDGMEWDWDRTGFTKFKRWKSPGLAHHSEWYYSAASLSATVYLGNRTGNFSKRCSVLKIKKPIDSPSVALYSEPCVRGWTLIGPVIKGERLCHQTVYCHWPPPPEVRHHGSLW
jgi:hypothetical protein